MSISKIVEQIKTSVSKCREGKAVFNEPVDLVNITKTETVYKAIWISDTYIMLEGAEYPNSYYLLRYITNESLESLRDAVKGIAASTPASEVRKKPAKVIVVEEEDYE